MKDIEELNQIMQNPAKKNELMKAVRMLNNENDENNENEENDENKNQTVSVLNNSMVSSMLAGAALLYGGKKIMESQQDLDIVKLKTKYIRVK